MRKDLENMKKKIKDNIQILIDKNRFDEASILIDEYFKMNLDDIDSYSLKAVVLMMEENINEAEKILKQGINIDCENFDLNYNLGYLYEREKEFNYALKYYKKALENCNDENLRADLSRIIEKILNENNVVQLENKRKMVFFVKNGMDSFLNDIIMGLSNQYETKKIIVTDYSQINQGMEWADICWFEWCDDLVIYGSKLDLAKKKKIICRLHSYEAFTDYPLQVNWNDVDNIIFDVQHIRDVVLKKVNIDIQKISLISVGVDTNKYEFKNRNKGFNVAYVGYINYKKGPMFLIQLINALVKKDNRYKLYVGGKFQDERDVLYFEQMIKELKLEKNLIYNGWIDNVNEWLEDKDYIVSTSLLEGQHLSVMEGMCKGIKPIIHNFVGAKHVYDKKYVWNTIDEAVTMIRDNKYNSSKYREYIINNYSNDQQLNKIKLVITKVLPDEKNKKIVIEKEKLVIVGIINYNYSQYLDQSIQSVLNQTYKNIEIVIIDDCSVDDSIEKIKQYEKRYNNIRGIYHTKNSGSAVRGIQEIIEEAKGEYLMFLSADDYLSSETSIYEYLINLVNESELDYIYSNLNIVDKDGIYKSTWEYKQYAPEDVIEYTFKRGGSGILPLTAGVYKTDFYRKKNMTWYDDKDNIVAGDTLNSLIYIKNNFKYKHINKGLISYRHHDKNMTYDIYNRIKSIISVLEYIINNFNEEIYFREINWNIFTDSRKRKSKKMYLIGMHYMSILKHYDNTMLKTWGDLEIEFKPYQIKAYIKPLALKVKEYFKQSLSYSNEYNSEIKLINEQIEEILNQRR